jgi:hypothetical protein
MSAPRGIWANHAPDQRIVDAAVHVNEREGVKLFLAGKAAGGQALDGPGGLGTNSPFTLLSVHFHIDNGITKGAI